MPEGCTTCWWPVLHAGNAARQLTQDLVKAISKQGKYNNPDRPVASKLAVDPYLRVIGARDIIALGDCSMMIGNRLPATAQVQQLRHWNCGFVVWGARIQGSGFSCRILATIVLQPATSQGTGALTPASELQIQHVATRLFRVQMLLRMLRQCAVTTV